MTPIRLSAAYLEARGEEEEAWRIDDMERYFHWRGKREAYAEALELDEGTLTAPPVDFFENGAKEFARVETELAEEYGAVVIFVPRLSDPSEQIGFFVSIGHACDLRDQLVALFAEKKPHGKEGGA